MRVFKQLVGLGATLFLLAGCATSTPSNRDFSIALLGDTQYNSRDDLAFANMFAALNKEQFAFVFHVGDFKAGSDSPCTDALFTARLKQYQQSSSPLVYIPGDNEFIDCQRKSNGAQDPLERIAKLRTLFYPNNESLGHRRIKVARQSDAVDGAGTPPTRYSENMRWQREGIIFFTVNVQGSNDGVGFNVAMDAEQRERETANIAWMQAAFALARAENAVGVVMFAHANPGFEEPSAKVAAGAYPPFLRAFEATAQAWQKPVLFAHGDTHQYRLAPYQSPIDRRPIANITRVETPGSPVTNWVRINVRPDHAAAPFEVMLGGMGF